MDRYLIVYGGENELFHCLAENAGHALEQFLNWYGVDADSAIYEVFHCVSVI